MNTLKHSIPITSAEWAEYSRSGHVPLLGDCFAMAMNGSKTMKIVLTKFAKGKHFDPARAGTVITDCSYETFELEMNNCIIVKKLPGYADFCKLLVVKNWTDAKVGTILITKENEHKLKSEYKARTDEELPVLVRWMEVQDHLRVAKFLVLVLYSAEQLKKEGANIGTADWGVVAILGQDHDQEEPMPPVTVMRNALGTQEGGSGEPLDREAYMRSVEFWGTHATVKVV